MDEQSLALFALNVLTAAKGLPFTNANGDQSTIRDVHEAYNQMVTPENQLTWGDFKATLRKAWEKDFVQFSGAAVKGIDNLDEVLEIDQPGSRKGKVYRSFWKTISKEDIPRHIKKVRQVLNHDWKDDVNQQLFDAMLRHQIYLMRLSGSVRNATFDLLNKTERDIADKIASRLKAHAGKDGLTPAAVRQMEWLEKYIKSVRLGSWDQITGLWVKEMSDLAKSEVHTTAGIVNTVSPTILVLNLPDARQLSKIATSNPFEGRILRDWAKTMADHDVTRMLNAIRVGMVQGDPIDVIVRRVVGSAGAGGADGVTELTRKQIAAIVRTAVNHIGNEARAEFINENSDVFSGERFVATLDARTTAICRANDGKVFAVGTGPRPPLHFNCRSLRVPVLSGEALGMRPARSHTQRQLLNDFADEEGIDRVSKRDDLPKGFKGAFDDFARQRIRDLTTRVPSATSYQAWLETQSRTFQNDVLGPTKAKLFREGKLPLDRFVDRAGNELSLSQLAKQHAEAFRAAGLNPEDFL